MLYVPESAVSAIRAYGKVHVVASCVYEPIVTDEKVRCPSKVLPGVIMTDPANNLRTVYPEGIDGTVIVKTLEL